MWWYFIDCKGLGQGLEKMSYQEFIFKSFCKTSAEVSNGKHLPNWNTKTYENGFVDLSVLYMTSESYMKSMVTT